MDNFAKPDQLNSARADTRTVLLRLAIFLFVLFTTHCLLHLLHPIGVKWFFLGLALGTLATSVAVSCLPLPLSQDRRDRNEEDRARLLVNLPVREIAVVATARKRSFARVNATF
jgi:hypothetical protein